MTKRYVIFQVTNRERHLSRKFIKIVDSIAQANVYSIMHKFGEFTRNEKHGDAWETEVQAYEINNIFAGLTQLIALEYDDIYLKSEHDDSDEAENAD